MNSCDRFYRDNRERVLTFLLHLTGDYDLARDLVQESFTRYLSRYGRDQSWRWRIVMDYLASMYIDIGDRGYWQLHLPLPVGEHRYAFILNGERRMADPTLPAVERDDFGGENSILSVEVQI